MIASLAGGYPSVDEVAVTVIVAVVLALVFAGAVTAWAAGRPGPAAPSVPIRPAPRPSFDVPCECDRASSNCTKKGDGTCD